MDLTVLTWKEILERIIVGFASARGMQNSQIEEIVQKLQPLDKRAEAARDPGLKGILATRVEPDQVDDLKKDRDASPASRRVRAAAILINDFSMECLKDANYDLRLGEEVYVTQDKLPRKLTNENDTVVIRPGEFGVLTTFEYVSIPTDLLGLISLRFRYKNLGLVNISGFHVDPGFTGRVLFSVFNSGPRDVALRYKDPVFMIMFERLERRVEGYDGKYGNQRNIPVDTVTSLGGPSVSVIALDRRIRSMQAQLRILEGILVGLIASILFYFLLGGQ